MADQSHLDILSQGVEAWNEWREQNPSIMPDLSRVDLTGSNLHGMNLSEANLHGANLSEAFLNEANLFRADLMYANLSQADFRGANLSETTNLTQEQIEQAKGDVQTKLPNHLKRPAAWSRSSDEEPSRDE